MERRVSLRGENLLMAFEAMHLEEKDDDLQSWVVGLIRDRLLVLRTAADEANKRLRKDIDDLGLGFFSDEDIAFMNDMSPENVKQLRTRRGIPSFRRRQKARKEAANLRLDYADWVAKLEAEFLKETNRAAQQSMFR